MTSPPEAARPPASFDSSQRAGRPIVLFLQGDGDDAQTNGLAAKAAIDQAVAKTYDDGRAIAWLNLLAGEKSHKAIGLRLPPATVAAIEQYQAGLKAPIALPETIDAACLSAPGLFEDPAALLKHLGWPEACDHL